MFCFPSVCRAFVFSPPLYHLALCMRDEGVEADFCFQLKECITLILLFFKLKKLIPIGYLMLFNVWLGLMSGELAIRINYSLIRKLGKFEK